MTIEEFLHSTLGADLTGHDEKHAYRVWENAELIMKETGGDHAYVKGCCLLHDCLDEKLGLNTEAQESKVFSLLLENGLDEDKAKRMLSSMKRMSFHLHDNENLSLEDKIIRDADRLDAVGEIGIARALAYGAWKGRPFFSEKDKIDIRNGFAPHSESTVSHFYEKLLRLDSGMHTETAKEEARKRKVTMIDYLKARFAEEGLPFDESLLP